MNALTLILMSMVFVLLIINGVLSYFLKQSRFAMNAMLALIVLSLNMLAYAWPLYAAKVPEIATVNSVKSILTAGVYVSLLIQLLIAMSLVMMQPMALIRQARLHMSWLSSCLFVIGAIMLFTAQYSLIVTAALTSMLMVTAFFQLKQCHSDDKKRSLLAFNSLLLGAMAFTFWVLQSKQYSMFALTSYNLIMVIYIFAAFVFICHQYRQANDVTADETQRQIELLSKQKMSAQNQLAAEHEAYQQLEVEMQTRNFELEVTMRELQEQNKKLEQLNTQDALTGVKNRRYFEQRIVSEFRRSRREKSPLSLIMLDIDRFKSINDNYGHLVGDQAIRQTARLMQQQLRRVSDCICRYGGEEFAIVLPLTDSKGAKQFSENLRTQLMSEQLVTSDVSLTITASFGVATLYANDNNNPGELIALADKALYQAKQQGRNRTVCAEQNIVLALNAKQSQI